MPLPQPTTPEGATGLAAILAEPPRALISLDFDGTLSPIVERPEDAQAAPGALEVLERLASSVGTLAIITGRPVRDIVRFAGLDDSIALAGLEVFGQYGVEHWAGGRVDVPDPQPGVAVARDRLREILVDAPDGIFVEDKRHALVVHTRRTPDPAGTLARLTPTLEAVADDTGLEAARGRYVLELRPRGAHKGGALRRLVRARAAGAVLFAGDDLGDVPAFDAVAELRREGVPGVAVCSGSDEVPELRARADLVVEGPHGVVAFLEALADALEGAGQSSAAS